MKSIIWIFISLIFTYSIFSYAFVDLNLSYLSYLYTGLYLNNRLLVASVYFALIIGLFTCFYYFICNMEKAKKYLGVIILGSLIMILSYPGMLSFDIFNYITTSKVAFYYQENPYVIYPIEFNGEPYLEFTRAANKTALYGPLWITLSAIPYFSGMGNFIITLISFKLFIAFFYIGTILIIKKNDEKALPFFVMNPLVIIEALGSSHNDVVMIFLALLSYMLFFGRSYFFSITAFAASSLIKFATLFLLPVYVIMIKGKIFNQKIDREKVFKYSTMLMFVIFLLSPIREEMYPWYAVWFIAFTSFLYKSIFFQKLVLLFSLGLMLRYIPYIATGEYFGFVPQIKIVLTLLPVLVYLLLNIITGRFKRN